MSAERPVSIEELLAHRAWVRELARTLVRDAHAADDLEQETWARTLDRPPRDARSLRGWFARVARHVLIDAKRSDKRRASRELAVARPEAAESDDVVARMDALRRVAQAAYELAEPYRTTLLLRYFEGLSIREIGKRLDAPQETIRTRLRRALELMRARLDVENEGNRGAWCAALMPLALGTGGVVVKTSTKVALAVAFALAAATGGMMWSHRSRRTESAEAPTPAAAPERRGSRVAKRTATPTVDAASFVGEARTRSDGRPAAGATVSLEDRASGRRIAATADAAGQFAFPSIESGRDFLMRIDAATATTAPRRIARFAARERRDVGIVWLDLVGELDVVVACASGSPDGAVVEVLRPPSPWTVQSGWTMDEGMRAGADPIASARIDATGRAKFPRVPAGDATIVARRAGCVTAVRDNAVVPAGGVATVSFLLEPCVKLEGRLVDSTHRGRAKLRVFGHSGPPTIGGFSWPSWSSAESGADGRFTLDSLAPGPVTVYLAADAGLTPIANVRTPRADVVEIVLERRVVAGVVTEMDGGRPVAGATVAATFGASAGSAVLRTTTDAEGRYALEAFVDGTFNGLHAEAAGFGPAEMKAIRTAPGAPAHVDLRVTRAVVVEGTVTTDGRPVAGAAVNVIWYDGMNTRRRDAETDAAGSYTAADVPAARLVVVQVVARGLTQAAWDWNYMTALMGRGDPSAACFVRTVAGVRARLDIAMTAGHVVTGRIEDPSGAPVSGANVGAVVLGGADRTVSDATGAFRLVGTPAKSDTVVSAWADGFAMGQTTIDTTSDVADARIVMKTSPRIRGTVRTADGGARPDGAVVRVVYVDQLQYYSDEASAWRSAAPVRVNDDGSFETPLGVERGVVRVRAEAPGFAQIDVSDLNVAPSAKPIEVALVLAPAARLEGKVVDAATEQPIEGARIALDLAGAQRRQNGWFPTQPIPCATTDASGAFVVPDLAPAKVHGNVKATGYVGRDFDVAVPSDGPFLLRLQATAPVASGVVLGPDRKPVASASVSAVPDAGEPPAGDWPWTSTDADGKFELLGLPIAGTWTVQVCPPPGYKFANRWVKVAGVVAGRTDVEIVLGGSHRIAGRVLTSVGEPAPGVAVRADSPTTPGASSGSTTTDDAGAFALEGLDDAAYDVDVVASSERRDDAWASVCRDLPTTASGVKADTESLVIRLDAGDAVSGVLLGEDGKPLAGAWLIASPPRGQAATNRRAGYFPCGGRTDAEGRFAVGGLQPGRYRVSRVELASIGAEPVFTPLVGGADVASNATGLTLRIPVLGEIDGNVVDEDGAAVAGARVEATLGTPSVVASATTAADGTFQLTRLDAARQHVLDVSRPGAFVPAKTGDVAPGTKDVVIRVLRGLRATGRILGPDGKPIPKGVVRFTPDGGGPAFSIVTEPEGRFDVAGLVDAAYRVEAVVVQTAGGKALHGGATLHAGDRDVELRFTE